MNNHPVEPNSHWSYPATPGGGMVWFGFFTVTDADITALKDQLGNNVGIDELSLVGRYHPDWTTRWNEERDIPRYQRSGGRGSPAYEAQYCGTGVSFTKEPLWHFKKNGDGPFMSIPANRGAYHRRYDGDGWTNWEGPEKGSQAAEILGRTAYHWDDEFGLYYAGPQAPTPWWVDA